MLKALIKSHLSPETLKRVQNARRFLRYVGIRFKCPICGGRFRALLPTGTVSRKNAVCPKCGSFERHRLLWLYLQEHTNFFTSSLKILHFAPEPFFQERLKRLPNLEYISADLYDTTAMFKMDITAIKFDDDSFDCILCSHVLEHVPDDRMALRELYRVLKLRGWAIFQVPIGREETFEDQSMTTPAERLKYFGQEDHVRIYGLDFKDRVEEAGFVVKVDPYLRAMDEKRVNRYRLVPENEARENVYFCTKSE